METKKIKVCYVISVLKNSTGKGGHFHSLKALVDKMRTSNLVSISVVIIGSKMPAILRSMPVFYIHTNWSIRSVFDVFNVRKILKKIDPDIIHCYDQVSLSIADIIINKPKVFTFCGGPDPGVEIFAPYCDNIIFFSRENMEYYKKIKRFRHLNLHYIPNRVATVDTDEEGVCEIRRKTGNGTVILRIGRFSGFYFNSYVQTIELFKELCSKNDVGNVKLVLIGAIESERIYNKLKFLSTGYDVFFFTEDKYTKESSKLIGAGDIVVGTGRSLMEAAHMSRILLSPIKNGRFPVLIDENSFEDCFRTNFSERNYVSLYDDKENLNKILNTIKDFEYRKKIKTFSRRMFDDYFSIEKAEGLHIEIYKNTKDIKVGYFNFFRIFMGFARILSNVIKIK